MPIDEQVSALDRLIDKIAQEDRQRRINQRIIPRYIDEAIENLVRSRIVRSRFKALLLLAESAAKDLNQAVNDQVTQLVKTRVNQQPEAAGSASLLEANQARRLATAKRGPGRPRKKAK